MATRKRARKVHLTGSAALAHHEALIVHRIVRDVLMSIDLGDGHESADGTRVTARQAESLRGAYHKLVFAINAATP